MRRQQLHRRWIDGVVHFAVTAPIRTAGQILTISGSYGPELRLERVSCDHGRLDRADEAAD
jgi:hypothetical protein